ncbi:uncharacterized protein GGS22DRAFT_191440 [Annulohypoxylon maeteangense]|uniref:uncharacterized protein n=1 Tax=Annulohypoxylon maeteangense TaxID=1927788 RepID=UPI002007F68C|nr:uncharacterized protein GGS22DRAFT_191440 [Annulohypoxylon maeteangense]KAI0882271.1 hypothetical protein GGS22DRAFT_191440 [Annulohypoxylon maeteangense]
MENQQLKTVSNMSSEWANWERELIRKNSLHNTGDIIQPSSFQEFGIQLVADIMDGSKYANNKVVEEIFDQMVKSGQPLEGPWHEFHPFIFSAAMSTSNDYCQKNLVALVIALAKFPGRQAITNPSKDEVNISKAESLFSDLTGFGMMAREYWNGPGLLLHAYGSHEAAQKAWVNLHRFMAHLSCAQMRDPTDSLDEWVEDFGLWAIAEGLEDQEGVKEWAEAAAAWLLIAGRDIYNDPTWGRRDGNKAPGVPLRDGPLWDCRLANGATQESRWEFWKFRLQELTKQAADAAVRNSAQHALEAMKRHESPA